VARASRVVVIGLDGLEPAIVNAMLQASELPHLASIRASGSYSRVATTTPAQTPVAWSTFATGVNPAVAQVIARGLSGVADKTSGQEAIRGAKTVREVYSGPYASEAPDVIVEFAAGYRVSWATALSRIPAGLVEDNVKKWSGDHIIDPALVPGVLFMNRPFRAEGARLADLAPSILAALGAPRGERMEGTDLLTP